MDWNDLEEPSAICEMCETRTIRYVHVMRHDRYAGHLRVGCECAAKMEEDREAAHARENTSKNLAQRRARWAWAKMKWKWGKCWEDGGGYYEALGVSRWSGEQQIKSAWWKLAKLHHPDRNPGDAVAEERFKEATAAYEVLSNPQKRAAYHAAGGGRVQVHFLNVNNFNIILRDGRSGWSIRITDLSLCPYGSERSRKEYRTMESASTGAFLALRYMEERRKFRALLVEILQRRRAKPVDPQLLFNINPRLDSIGKVIRYTLVAKAYGTAFDVPNVHGRAALTDSIEKALEEKCGSIFEKRG